MLKQLLKTLRTVLATGHHERYSNIVIEQVLDYKMAINRHKAGWSPAYPETPNAEHVIFDLFIEKDSLGKFILSCVSKEKLLHDDESHTTLSEAKERAGELWGVHASEWLLP